MYPGMDIIHDSCKASILVNKSAWLFQKNARRRIFGDNLYIE
jgi:hypothetical protein